jgi:3-deoxy-D-manno-octulosonic-acid transferase
MWLLYQVLYAFALLVAAPFLLARRGFHYLTTLPGRSTFQRTPPGAAAPPRRPLWIHAVSVGEVGVAATLAAALPAHEPLLVTTVTPTGQQRARKLLAGRAAVAYLPFDLGFAVSRFLRRFAPRALVLVEGDYWPLLLRRARRRGLAVVVVNGRVGDRSFRRLRRLRRLGLGRLLDALFAPVGRFGVQTDEDRRRLAALGVAGERVTVTGNLKFETPEPPPLPRLEARLAELAGGRPLLVAGSTMAGEEERVLDAFRAAGGGGAALLVLAPRHPERCDEVARLLDRQGWRALRRSRFDDDREGDAGEPGADVVLLDTLGELASIYRRAAVAFIGGTLVPTGGHNPLEAARFGVPVAVGPSMDNFRDMAARFAGAGAWELVPDAAALGRVLRRWLADPASARRVGERARALVEENRGALERTVELVRPLLAADVLAADGGEDGRGGG